MSQETTTLRLVKPSRNDSNWGNSYNDNFQIIDDVYTAQQDKINDFAAALNTSKPIIFQKNAESILLSSANTVVSNTTLTIYAQGNIGTFVQSETGPVFINSSFNTINTTADLGILDTYTGLYICFDTGIRNLISNFFRTVPGGVVNVLFLTTTVYEEALLKWFEGDVLYKTLTTNGDALIQQMPYMGGGYYEPTEIKFGNQACKWVKRTAPSALEEVHTTLDDIAYSLISYERILTEAEKNSGIVTTEYPAAIEGIPTQLQVQFFRTPVLANVTPISPTYQSIKINYSIAQYLHNGTMCLQIIFDNEYVALTDVLTVRYYLITAEQTLETVTIGE